MSNSKDIKNIDLTDWSWSTMLLWCVVACLSTTSLEVKAVCEFQITVGNVEYYRGLQANSLKDGVDVRNRRFHRWHWPLSDCLLTAQPVLKVWERLPKISAVKLLLITHYKLPLGVSARTSTSNCFHCQPQELYGNNQTVFQPCLKTQKCWVWLCVV